MGTHFPRVYLQLISLNLYEEHFVLLVKFALGILEIEIIWWSSRFFKCFPFFSSLYLLGTNTMPSQPVLNGIGYKNYS